MLARKRTSLSILLAVILSGNMLLAEGWQAGTPLLTARSNTAAVYLDGYIYAIGGTGSGGVILTSVERYEIASGQWDQSVAQLEEPRSEAVALVHDGKIFLIGGIEEDGDIEDDVLIYDPAANTWTEGEDLNESRRGHGGFYANNTMCIVGGLEEDGDLIEDIEYYDLVEQKWEKAPSDLASPISSAFIAALDDTLYRFGGSTNFPQSTGARGQFDLGWNFQWQSGPELSARRANGATAVLNGKICMIGGVDTGGDVTDLVEFYDPTDGQVKVSTDTLPTPRRDLVAVVANDTIYAIGGYTSSVNQPLTRVDVYADKPIGIEIGDRPATFPQEFELATAYPNPFNGQVRFDLRIGKRQAVTFRIFNLNGQPVATIYSGTLNSGRHTLSWHPANSGFPVSSGIYFAVLEGISARQAIKINYIR